MRRSAGKIVAVSLAAAVPAVDAVVADVLARFHRDVPLFHRVELSLSTTDPPASFPLAVSHVALSSVQL